MTNENVDNDQCWIMQKTRYGEHTGMFSNETIRIAGGFEGIPEIFLMNLVLYTLMILLFSLLRRRAWNYGRMALLERSGEKPITQLLYGSGVNESGSNLADDKDDNQNSQKSNESQSENLNNFDSSVLNESNYLSWICKVFTITDQHILAKCGPDATQYAAFQRVLILFVSVVCILSIAITLPVNFQGNYVGEGQKFGHTTISNIAPNSDLLWIHCSLSVVFLLIAAYLMKNFAMTIKGADDEQMRSNAVMIWNLPRTALGNETMIRNYFEQGYPQMTVYDVQYAYDIAHFARLNRKRKAAEDAVKAIENEGTNPLMKPFHFGRICRCCGPPAVYAKEFYHDREKTLYDRCLLAQSELRNEKPLPVVFVTFSTVVDADLVAKDFQRWPIIGIFKKKVVIPRTPFNGDLGVFDWHIKVAPKPDNIYWENLSTPFRLPRILVGNLFLFALLFFLTTPSMIMTLWYKLGMKMHAPTFAENANPLISDGIPTLLLLTFASLLPPLIYYVEYYGGWHWTKSGENLHVMRKTFIFLLFMLLILPSLGLMSGPDFLKYIFTPNGNMTLRWKCVFLPDNGGFFVNYVTSSAFVGTAAELLRCAQLFWYLMVMAWSRSKFEGSYITWLSLYDFPFGINYAWMLAIFAITLVYSLVCPLIAPFGLVYLLLKYFVDRYNLYYAYAPSRISKSIHRSAVSFVLFTCWFAQIVLLAFIFVRSGSTLNAKSMFMLATQAATLVLLFGHTFFGWFYSVDGQVYEQFDNETEEPNMEAPDISTDPNQHISFNVRGQFEAEMLPARNEGGLQYGEGERVPLESDNGGGHGGNYDQLSPDRVGQNNYQSEFVDNSSYHGYGTLTADR